MSSNSTRPSLHPTFIFLLLVLLVFSLLVANQLSGSSIGLNWFYLFGEVDSDSNLLIGYPRTIRSDEYSVETPWTIMESRVGFRETNPFIGLGQNLILTDVPIWHWSLIFTPQNWGYFFLPLENGFAFHWWFKGLILILGVYLLTTRLLNGQHLFSALIALSALFSPAIQWWYATSLTETFGYFFLILFLAIQLVNAQTSRTRNIYTVLFTYAIGCFIFLGYVPALIPTVLALSFLIAGLIIQRFFHRMAPIVQSDRMMGIKAWFRQLWSETCFRRVLLALFIALAVNLVILLVYTIDERAVIDTVLTSVYPGERRECGGDMLPVHLLGGFYNIQLLWDGNYYFNLNIDNQCEASSYFMLSIFLLPLFIVQQLCLIKRKQRPDFLLIAAILFFMLALCWAFIGLPSWLSHITLLDRVPAKRMITIFGSLNLFLIVYFFAKPPFPRTQRYRKFSLLYAIITALFYFYSGYSIEAKYPGFFFNSLLIYIVPVFVFLLLFSLLNYSKRLFAISLLTLSMLSAFYINPLYRGLSVIQDTEIAQEINRISSQPENEDALWVFFDSVFPNYAAANGARVINATQYHPQPDLWKNFDPEGKYEKVYNRYAHIRVSSVANDSIEFSLEQADVLTLKINPCNLAFMRAGVRYFVFHEPVDCQCLQLVKSVPYPNQSFYIYQRETTAATP